MLKKILLVLAIALPMLAGAQTIKVGVVDVQSIIPELPAYKTAQTALEAKLKQYQDAGQKMVQEYQQKVQEFQALPADTPDPIRANAASQIQQLEQRLSEYEQMMQTQMQQAQNEAFQPIMTQVQNAVQAVGAEGGFTFVAEKQSFLYIGTSAEDITPAVKARLGLK